MISTHQMVLSLPSEVALPARHEHPGVLNGTKLQVLFSVEGNWEKIRARLSTHWLARA